MGRPLLLGDDASTSGPDDPVVWGSPNYTPSWPAYTPSYTVTRAYAYIRTLGGLRVPLPLRLVAQCSHDGIGGGVVTEALVCGVQAAEVLRNEHPDAELVKNVASHEWVENCLLAAAGHEVQCTPGQVAVMALKAPGDELYLVEHPRALPGLSIVMQALHCLNSYLDY